MTIAIVLIPLAAGSVLPATALLYCGVDRTAGG
jgi:hypothetical protein